MGPILLAVLLAADLTDAVPAHWPSNDPKSIDLLSGSPINCLLLEEPLWSRSFAEAAASRKILTLGIVRPSVHAGNSALKAINMHLTGVALEGDFEPAAVLRIKESLGGAPLVAMYNGPWPGIRSEQAGAVLAGPTGSPTIWTNSHFLRSARSEKSVVRWIACVPPPKTLQPVQHYLQAIGDAAVVGAAWVLSFDDDFNRRLMARDNIALRDWNRINAHLRFLAAHREWNRLPFASQLAAAQVRLYNAASVLYSLSETADKTQKVLYLLNFSDYPIESITVRLPGQYKRVRLYTPEVPVTEIEGYPAKGSTDVDVARLVVLAVLVLE